MSLRGETLKLCIRRFNLGDRRIFLSQFETGKGNRRRRKKKRALNRSPTQPLLTLPRRLPFSVTTMHRAPVTNPLSPITPAIVIPYGLISLFLSVLVSTSPRGTDGRTNLLTDGRTYLRTDAASYRCYRNKSGAVGSRR